MVFPPCLDGMGTKNLQDIFNELPFGCFIRNGHADFDFFLGAVKKNLRFFCMLPSPVGGLVGEGGGTMVRNSPPN
jgi:hypothetical protein